MTPAKNIRTLLVCPNPRGTDALRTDREERVLRESIQLSRSRDAVEVETLRAATVDDLRRALREAQYDIVHFSGHGTRRGLIFEDESGRLMVPRTEALARLLARHEVETVILNACYSLDVGTIAPIGTKYTIVMDGPIADTAAIEFSRGFYDAICDGDDVPGAFREGIDCAELKNLTLSAVLLPDGLRYPPPAQQAPVAPAPAAPAVTGDRARGAEDDRRLLLGIALDVSGSMKESIGGAGREARTRLESAKDALRGLSETIGRSQLHQVGQARPGEDRLRIFAYCFGTRIAPGFDDLFGTMLAARQLDISTEVERRKRDYTAAARRQASGYSDLESLARGIFGGRTVDQLKGSLQAGAEQEIRQRITAEIAHLLRDRASKIERTVLSLGEFADLFDANRGADLGDFEALVYGATPLCAVAEQIVERFRGIPRIPDTDEARTLLVISDGQPTDGDPLPQFQALKDAGVVVVSCYVTSADVADPRMLLSHPEEHWDAGARLMFDAASPLDESGEFAGYLLRHGWTIERDAKMFVQINHSDVLEEFVSAVGSRLEEQEAVGLLPVGQ